MPAVRVNWRSVTCHDEFPQRVQENAKRAEKTSKEAAAQAFRQLALRAADGHEIHRCKQRKILGCLHLWIS